MRVGISLDQSGQWQLTAGWREEVVVGEGDQCWHPIDRSELSLPSGLNDPTRPELVAYLIRTLPRR